MLAAEIKSASESRPQPAENAKEPEILVEDLPLEPSPLPSVQKVNNPTQSEKRRIPMVMNASVQRWIEYFTVRDRIRFQRFLDRGERYREVVESVLEENDIPAELFYLAMIESGYRTEAHSHAKARGVWQFIPGTAERYGLRIDRYVDERQDPIRSTEAAAKYLRDLYNVFGSWHLAMAGYNAGEIRVLRAVFKGKSRNFWKLSEAKALPKETAEYVPKFLAVVLIGQNPEKYGFRSPHQGRPYPSVEAIVVPGSLTLTQIAKVSNIPVSTLEAVNPHLKGRTPSGKEYELWVPSAQAASLARAKTALAKAASKYARQIASAGFSSETIHKVRRGECLESIARRYKLSVGHLKRINGLKSNRLYVGARLRIKSRSYQPSKTVRYIVKRGDNLTFIANKFKTTVKRVRALNKLRKNTLAIGQVLRLEAANLN
jgi:membrane-bound lytic murein transglycosylase D